jgi:nucleoid-associated protein YgaU
MRQYPSRHASIRLALVSAWPLLLGSACSLTASTLAAEPGISIAAAAPTLETLEQLHQQLNTLRSRVQGMEGKLKESALARKGADQARMEAERRLAEGEQALDQLNAEASALRATRHELEQRLTDSEDVAARLQTELQSTRTAHDALAARLSDLQRRLPESEGGTLTADAARKAAAAAFLVLREATQNPDAAKDPAMMETIQRAEAELHRTQFKLASVMAAKSLYGVRANDTLASISNRFYGNSAQWRILFDANRHVLEDPDQLAPGMTLIIP